MQYIYIHTYATDFGVAQYMIHGMVGLPRIEQLLRLLALSNVLSLRNVRIMTADALHSV